MAARIIIPVWGSKYVARLGSACLPALLAPGNLPHLAAHFDCELVIVTQAALFDQVRSLEPVKAALKWCRLRLVAMDDVLSHPNYYGYTITHALYRGFTDLGDAARDVWCLFLNADFILADGSYRTLVARMQGGERCILAPSYCTIEEGVRPALERRLGESAEGVLRMPPREMAGLILDNRHFTIRAKIINWRMYRIDRVDQFYYVVDNDTMVGRQIPVAVVAFRPERVPLEPVAFWDYGVISEVCPDSKLCVLGDSDDFLMMELRGRNTMSEQLKLGWMDKDEIARDLTVWTTRDQRLAGEHTLVLHRKDPPADLAAGVKALEDYYRDVMSRVSPQPRDHRNHYIWTGVVDLHRQWLASREAAAGAAAQPGAGGILGAGREMARGAFGKAGGGLYRRLFDVMRAGYRVLFGRPPEVGAAHPYGADLRLVLQTVRDKEPRAQRALAVWSLAGAAMAPHLSRWIRDVDSLKPEDVLGDAALQELKGSPPYDLCFLELSKDEFLKFGRMYARLRGLVRPGGRLIVFYRTRGQELVEARNYRLIANGLPDHDVAELQFTGGFLSYTLQGLWERKLEVIGSGRTLGLLRLVGWAALIGPLAWLANLRQGVRAGGEVSRYCTSMRLEVTVLR